ncbi:MAG: hypothetical protein AB7V27_09045 [Candidatus Binatia bacterium]
MPGRLGWLVAALVYSATGARAADGDPDSPWLDIHTYDADGPFVTAPAKTVGIGTYILVGGAAALACTPVDLARALPKGEGYGETAKACGAGIGKPAGRATYIAAGAPFWLVKKVAWDFPRRLFTAAASPDAPRAPR